MKNLIANHINKIALILTVILLMVLSTCTFAQVTQDKDGNYIESPNPEKKSDIDTGKTYTDSKGKVYKVYRGSRGGLYVWRTRTRGENIGKKYKYYLSRN